MIGIHPIALSRVCFHASPGPLGGIANTTPPENPGAYDPRRRNQAPDSIRIVRRLREPVHIHGRSEHSSVKRAQTDEPRS